MTLSPLSPDVHVATPSPAPSDSADGGATHVVRTRAKSAGLDRLLTVLVAAGAVVLAVSLWRSHAAAPDLLWRDVYHDRNGHFGYGLDLALALQTFDPLWFLSELEKAKVWPPLHGLVLSAVLLAGGHRSPPRHRARPARLGDDDRPLLADRAPPVRLPYPRHSRRSGRGDVDGGEPRIPPARGRRDARRPRRRPVGARALCRNRRRRAAGSARRMAPPRADADGVVLLQGELLGARRRRARARVPVARRPALASSRRRSAARRRRRRRRPERSARSVARGCRCGRGRWSASSTGRGRLRWCCSPAPSRSTRRKTS